MVKGSEGKRPGSASAAAGRAAEFASRTFRSLVSLCNPDPAATRGTTPQFADELIAIVPSLKVRRGPIIQRLDLLLPIVRHDIFQVIQQSGGHQNAMDRVEAEWKRPEKTVGHQKHIITGAPICVGLALGAVARAHCLCTS